LAKPRGASVATSPRRVIVFAVNHSWGMGGGIAQEAEFGEKTDIIFRPAT